jgi:hypothetical protein
MVSNFSVIPRFLHNSNPSIAQPLNYQIPKFPIPLAFCSLDFARVEFADSRIINTAVKKAELVMPGLIRHPVE